MVLISKHTNMSTYINIFTATTSIYVHKYLYRVKVVLQTVSFIENLNGKTKNIEETEL